MRLSLLLCSLLLAVTRTRQQVQDTTTEECRVVHNYCSSSGSAHPGTSQASVLPGPPGKRGPVGETGFKGEKGDKGNVVASVITDEQIQEIKQEVIRQMFRPTKIYHDSMSEIKAIECEPHGCYKRDIHYHTSMDDIESLMQNSTYCRQYIKYRCQHSILLLNSDQYGWWVSRAGTKMNYWGGATSRRDGFCACGESGTCRNTNRHCNCDANINEELFDEGYLDDKDVLPVTQLLFGDMGGSNEHGWHTLGPLECF